jgi:predicted tellurium resistance membrane protein TerC
MAIVEQLYSLSKAYPVISIILAAILFYIGLKITSKILKIIFWIIAGILIIATI